jgi:hypothetical protein
MGITIKQYVDFGSLSQGLGGNLITSTSWDTLRLINPKDNPFFLHSERQQWREAAAKNIVLKKRAKDIADYVIAQGFEGIVSLGVGAAHFEYWINQCAPSLKIYCSDYAPRTVRALSQVFSEAAEIVTFDILNGPWEKKPGKLVYLLNRVDTEFDDQQWDHIAQGMSKAGIKDIIFIPNTFLTLSVYIKKTLKPLLLRLVGKPLVFAGYVRTRKRLQSILGKYYNVQEGLLTVGELKALVLSARS